jgi:hypothetical protein
MAMKAIVVVATLLAAGCPGKESVFGPPTESVCPPVQTLTYDNFGRQFMETYCTRCHHSELMGDDRMGAPSFHDFDTLFGIKAVSDHVAAERTVSDARRALHARRVDRVRHAVTQNRYAVAITPR